jgi:glycosyltransferase involved in cell wall biosynthesis
MKILQLCLKPPLPARDGGCIAMNNITQGLLEAGHQVKVLTIFTQKHDFNPELMPEEYIAKTDIEGVFVDTHVNVVDAFATFMTSDSYNISRFFSTDFDLRIMKLLRREQFDVVHLESLFMTVYLGTIRRYSKAPVVLRSHNLEYVIWEKIANGTRNSLKRTYLKYLSKKLKQYELKMLNEVTGVAAISEEDKQRFIELGTVKPIATIPFGLDLSAYNAEVDTAPELALFHLGAMDWSPNLEGILWFLQEVWHSIHARHPHLKLYLAGRNMPSDLLDNSYPNVEVIGEVDDAKRFMKSKAIMIVPLLSGGGVRVKIIEGLALAKPIISTSIGAEGVDCVDHEQLLIADTPDQWVEAIDELIGNATLRDELGRNGRKHAENFHNQRIIEKLIGFYKSLQR